MLDLSTAQATAFRLSKNHLLHRLPKNSIETAVSDACGVQAQVLSSAELAIGARVREITQTDVEAALWKRRVLVKTWAMRGTLHLITRSDFPLYVSALRQRLDPDSPVALPRDRLKPSEAHRTISAIRATLDGKNLTRQELADGVARRMRLDGEASKELLSGWGSMLHPAAFEGALCFGPSQGQNVKFVRPDQWLGPWRYTDGGEAVNELARRFIATYGPSTTQDFQHWWGWLKPKASRTIFDSIGNDLEEVRLDGRKAWMLKSDTAQIPEPEQDPTVHLLPSWDCYVMFYSPRQLFIEDAHRTKLFSQLQGNLPGLIINGLAAGTWQKRTKKNMIEIKVHPFKPLGSKLKSLVRETAENLGEFLARHVQLSFPH